MLNSWMSSPHNTVHPLGNKHTGTAKEWSAGGAFITNRNRHSSCVTTVYTLYWCVCVCVWWGCLMNPVLLVFDISRQHHFKPLKITATVFLSIRSLFLFLLTSILTMRNRFVVIRLNLGGEHSHIAPWPRYILIVSERRLQLDLKKKSLRQTDPV